MTIAELQSALLNQTHPESVQINSSSIVSDVKKFLTIQFAECERWPKEIEKCPAYQRLLQFHEATKNKA
ncbi:hypothetical protein GQF61_16075 [Sphingobacterium sp. DK4209]|uniref:DUF6965 domain-containing protein n=1 Tax=Sphingobacterium zhuxiongii TaxID=2662364 RepID=A0A5Q0QGD4_9SPHI|nr:hypothetical protein [Sphingobacterium sp. DK4209]MVZ67372.1 hypothetical protein [Sphingobacterium sp. DK4209]QGA26310.1 hypothetical protein GFH32_08205 [Sphingobacterium sp. dk4302]